MPHITQIAAVDVHSSREFNCYVLPKLPQSTEAQHISGIVVSASNKMTVNGTEVEPETIHSAVTKFIEWLERHKKVILIAHNGRKFDFPVFMTSLVSADTGIVSRFCEVVVGFVDSIAVFRKVFPGQSSYKQEDLVKNLVNATYNAHNALEDTRSLGWLLTHSKLDIRGILPFSFAPLAVKQQLQFSAEKSKNIVSLHQLVAAGVMKMTTAENIAGSGLCIQHLQKIFSRDGEDGLRNTFTNKNENGQPRVTNVKKTLDEVISKLVEYFDK